MRWPDITPPKTSPRIVWGSKQSHHFTDCRCYLGFLHHLTPFSVLDLRKGKWNCNQLFSFFVLFCKFHTVYMISKSYHLSICRWIETKHTRVHENVYYAVICMCYTTIHGRNHEYKLRFIMWINSKLTVYKIILFRKATPSMKWQDEIRCSDVQPKYFNPGTDLINSW